MGITYRVRDAAAAVLYRTVSIAIIVLLAVYVPIGIMLVLASVWNVLGLSRIVLLAIMAHIVPAVLSDITYLPIIQAVHYVILH